MTELIQRLSRDHWLSTTEYATLIRERTPETARELARLADRTRREIYGTQILIRGAVELSSICKNDCLYCIQRRSNRDCDRYRLRPREIWITAPSSSGAARTDFTTTTFWSP